MEQEVLSLMQGKESGQYRFPCPNCAHTRKKLNQREPTLSVKHEGDAITWQCWHCEETGAISLRTKGKSPVKRKPTTHTTRLDPVRAVKLQRKELSFDALMWLQGRGINKDTADHFGLYSASSYIPKMGGEVECIGFPYREARMDEPYAAKLRALDEKAFTQKGAAQTFFGMEALPDDTTEVIIVEGEMDALACYQAGCKAVISVPNGAVLKVSEELVDPSDDKKFQFIWRAQEFLDGLKKVIIATDMDEKGEALAEEISRRIGKDRCWRAEWSEKDANATLLEYGAEQVLADLKEAEPWPVAGLYEAETFRDKLAEIYDKGMGRGASTGYPAVDEYMTVMPGQVSIVTGVPSHGKSEFVDQLMVNLAEAKNWRFAIASFENEPELHIAKLISKRQRGQFFKHGDNRISRDQMEEGFEWVCDHFSFVHQADGDLATIESILERFRVAVMRYGIRGAVIDPYNYIRRDDRFSETDWISQMLTMIVNFARSHGVHVWFIAHPRILRPREDGTIPVPKGYDISGSAAWFAKADLGVTIHRDTVNEPDLAEIHIWKCRFSWIGKQGQSALLYDVRTTRYYEPGMDSTDIEFTDDDFNLEPQKKEDIPWLDAG